MLEFAKMRPAELLRREGFDCACGRRHATGLRDLRIARGALRYLPEVVRVELRVPANAWATLTLPDAAEIAAADGIEFEREGGDAVARVGSGAYAVVYRRNG